MTEQSTKDSQQLTTPCGKSLYLFEENMVSVDTHLDQNKIQSMERENATLAKRLNEAQFRLRQRVLHRQTLERELGELRRQNGAENATEIQMLEDTIWRCAGLERKCVLAALDGDTYRHVLQRTRVLVSLLRVRTQETKTELGKTDALVALAGETQSQSEAQGQLRENEALRLRLEAAGKVCVDVAKKITDVKARTRSMESAQRYQKLREERLRASIVRMRERKEHFQHMVAKLTLYHDEFARQHSRLTHVFHAEKKEEILRRKEQKDIELQSEQIAYAERVSRIQSLDSAYCELRKELAHLRASRDPADERTRVLRLYDRGEYSVDAPASEFVAHKMELRRVQGELEEKLGFVRRVVGGIKHILFKLRENDREDETGTWYDLSVVAAIADISTPETRPKFSKLLLILEEKISCLYTLILQKVKHLPVYMADVVIAPEEIADRPTPEVELIAEHSDITECCAVLRRYIDASAIVGTQTRGSSKTSPAPTENGSSRPFAGAEIPRVAGRFGRIRRMTLVLEPPAVQSLDQAQKTEEGEPDSVQRGFANLDMMAVNENAFELVLHQKRQTHRMSLSQAAIALPSKELEAVQREQASVRASFNKGRTKTKLLLSKEELTKSGTAATMPQHKRKGRVTDLTIAIERAMRRRPTEIVDMATTTFDAMEKLRRGADVRSIKQVESNPALMPNFLNAILSMKRSRGCDDISRVASHCTYFTNIPVSQPKDKLGKLSKPKYKANSFCDDHRIDSVETILHRLANVRSLNKLESARPGFSTAFEKYYYHGCGASKLSLPQIKQHSSRNQSMRTAGPSDSPISFRIMGSANNKYTTANVRWNRKDVGRHMFTLGAFAKDGGEGKDPELGKIYRIFSSVSLALYPRVRK